MRLFLNMFRLPGEGPQIDRIIEKFSKAYRLDNPSYFDKKDEEFVFAYLLIMLNTINHKPNVDIKDKLTKEFFIRQCKQAAPTYPEDQFPGIYDRIT